MGEHDFVPKLCCVRIQKLNMNGGEAQSLHLANSSSSVDKHESDHCRGIRGIDGHESLKKSLMLEPRDSSLQLGDVLGCEPIGELIDVETNHGKRRPLDVHPCIKGKSTQYFTPCPTAGTNILPHFFLQ